MNFDEVEKIIEEGKFKKAVSGALLGATLASGAMAQQAKVRTRRPANIDHGIFELKGAEWEPTELKDTIMQMPEIYTKEDNRLFYGMTLLGLKDDKKSDYLKIQKQYLNKEITREEAVKKLVDGGILNATRAKGQPSFWDDLKS